MRVLFVDDEPRVLEGIQRSLFALDRDWDVMFADSGAHALQQLEHDSADVVVSDMRMPGMDGAELLESVQQRWPAVLRIVLSGHTEQDAALRAMRVAHQFLSKPCQGVDLVDAIERLINVRELLQSPRLRELLGRVTELPPSPRSYLRISELLKEPECSTAALSAVVEQDPALSSSVLKLANSAFFRRSHPILGVHAAVVRLGVSSLRHLVLAAECYDERRVPNAEILRGHALLASLIAKQLAPPGCDPECCASAALLAEVGYLIPEALQAAGECDEPVTHAQIGAYLLGIWGLPLAIIDAVVHHLQPGRFEPQRFGPIGVVHSALALASDTAPDMQHLHKVGVDQHWPTWQALTEALRDDKFT